MCTAVSFTSGDHYFGRTLDLEYSYSEQVVITPKNYAFKFLNEPQINNHHAIIGIATVANNYPLYYDASNNKGLAMAGLNFPGNAHYKPVDFNVVFNVAAFEFIPFILSQCATVQEAVKLIENVNITDQSFNSDYKATPLHWMISDKSESVTVEPLGDGVKIYQNKVGVLTNNPPFEWHMTNLKNYISLTSSEPENRFCDGVDLTAYSKGMGAIGLPGDLSSASRFVRAAFVTQNSVCGETQEQSVSQFFHILGSVTQQRGCVKLKDNKYVESVYTSCFNTEKGLFYYTTYNNSQISCVDINREDLCKNDLICYPLITKQQINYQN